MEINRSVKRISEARHFHGLKFNMKDSTWVDSSSSHGKSALGTYKTTTRPYKGMSLPVFIRLPSHMQCNPVARVQFLKHTFAEHLLCARRALVCWILPQRKVSPSFITCNQWGHRGFHSSRKCAAGAPKEDQRASPSVGGTTVYNILHYLCNKSHSYFRLSFQHFCSWYQQSLFRNQILSNFLQLNVIN